MANAVQSPFNTSPAYSGTFIPQVWASKLNIKFYKTTVLSEIANTSYEGEIKSMGDKVIVNNVPSITINDYTIGQSLTYQVPTPSTVELNIDKAKYFGVNVSDVLAYQSQPKLMDAFTSDASKQMAIVIDRDTLFERCTGGAAANKGATAGAISARYDLGTDLAPVTLTTANVLTLITNMASVLDEQNVPDTDRYLIIPPFVRTLLMSSPLSQAYVTGDNSSILRNGKIGTIDRFTLYVSNNLPEGVAGKALTYSGNGPNAGTLASALARTAMIAGHKSAITFASQIAKVESVPNPNDFGTLVRGLNVYGSSVIKPEGLALALVK